MAVSSDGPRNVRVISGSNLLTGTYNNLLQVVLQPFVVRVAGSVVVLSVLQTIASRVGGIIGSLAQLVAGTATDRLGRRPVMIVGSACNLASLTLFLLTAVTGAWLLVVLAFVFLGLGLMSNPASQSAVAESVAAHGRAMAYSKVQFFLVLPASLAAFAGGYLADRFGAALIFALSLSLEAANFLLFVFVLKETIREKAEGAWSLRRLARLRTPPLRNLLIVTTVDSFVWTISSMIIYGIVSVQFGFTQTDIGIIVGVWAVVFAAATLPVGKLVERFGSRGMMFFSEALGIPIMLGWILARTPLEFAFISIFNGLTAATWVPAWQTLVANSVDDRARGEAIGHLTAVRGLLAFPAPLLGGFLYERFGYAAPMIASLAGVVLAMALVLLLIVDPRVRAA